MNDVLETVPEKADGVSLDPFGRYPQWSSRIPSLGGDEPAPDPSYLFATADSVMIGAVRVHVVFHDLAISHGTLLFEVLARSALSGSEPTRLQTVAVDAAELIDAGAAVTLEFDGYRNTLYGIACSINDETDMAASAISITLDHPKMPIPEAREWEWPAGGGLARRRPGIEPALIARVLTDPLMPRLSTPQSQVGSPLQCHEPIFAEVMTALQRPVVASFENWSLTYVVQAITRYATEGPLRMLGYGEDQAPLLSYFASRRHEVVSMRHSMEQDDPIDPGAALHQLWVPEVCSETDFFAHSYAVAGDIRQPVLAFQSQFDVLWSIGANRLMTPAEYVYFVVNGLNHAKPGGLAVHVFDYVEDVYAEGGHSLTQHNVERMAVLALSHLNDVARLQFLHGTAPPGKDTPLPFGFVLLRGGAA